MSKVYDGEKTVSSTSVAGKSGDPSEKTSPPTGVGEDMGNKEPLYTAGGNAS
jgi:hypothetical protein